MDHFPSNWGKPRQENDQYNTMPLYSTLTPATQAWDGPIRRTTSPMITGTSVIAFKYKDGIMMAADNLASFGSLARFRSVERMYPVGQHTIIGASGEISDFQYIKHVLDSLMIKEYYTDDGHVFGTPHIFEYLFRVMYNRRSKFNPLWNMVVVGGLHKGEKFLGFVNLKGTTYQASTVATGYGAYMAQPILRKRVEGNEDTLTEEEAIELVNTCMKTLFYRDARSFNKFQRAKVTEAGVEITAPYSVETEWSFAE
ncbi:nucleophile aminohydrolase [Endogone sp. FLAS-F59071]|nr:nucleophile aminohydrolase [Endogone sp. FLAS-F59071]|eukprot:RUS20609.1 nucleophile aminohydrolase [Endogone sp. FLAS-F59071]